MSTSYAQVKKEIRITSSVAGWKLIVNCLKQLAEEASFQVRENDLVFSCMDASKSSMFYFEWNKSNMVEYKTSCTKAGEEFDVGFRTDDLEKILKRFEKTANVIVSITEKGELQFDSGKKQFEIKILSSTFVGKQPLPNVKYEAKFSMSYSDFEEIIGDCSATGEKIRFVVNEGKMHVFASGDRGKSKIEVTDNISGEGDSEYAIEFINDFMLGTRGFVEKIDIEFKTKAPILMQSTIPGIGMINYFAAPIVGND